MAEVGDWVLLDENAVSVEVLQVFPNQKAMVAIGEITTIVEMSRLTKAQVQKKGNTKPKGKSTDWVGKRASFESKIDIRGMRAEEAMVFMDSWLDEAILLNINSLEIIHGKGNGVLRNIIRTQIKKIFPSAKMEDGPVDFGGAGITLVKI